MSFKDTQANYYETHENTLKNPSESGKAAVDSAFPASYRDTESVRGWRTLPLAAVVSGTAELLAFIQIPLWSPRFIPSGFFLF